MVASLDTLKFGALEIMCSAVCDGNRDKTWSRICTKQVVKTYFVGCVFRFPSTQQLRGRYMQIFDYTKPSESLRVPVHRTFYFTNSFPLESRCLWGRANWDAEGGGESGPIDLWCLAAGVKRQ